MGIILHRESSEEGTHQYEEPLTPGLHKLADPEAGSHISRWAKRCQPEEVMRGCCLPQAFWDDPCEKRPP